ncbi:MAG: oligosaccharide flippase family protein [Streptococcaceae bacterium]|jgi:O-antigen/teichoic acid export membrane protein|nr:oligosaccharide flippase family protein [Streptococcaceae bacterium]MCH4176955.1 oligosaccharide flippase family protein [Streptococcaceae bacterium]
MKKVATNVIFRLLYQILTLAMPIITIPIVSNVLGPEGIGEYKYLYSILSYFLLFASLGLGIYGNRTIATHRENRQTLSRIFWEIELSSVVTSLIALSAFLIFGLLIHQNSYYYILSIFLIANLFEISWFYAGIEAFGMITIVNMIVKIFLVGAIITLIHQPSDLIWYFVIQSIQGLLSNLSLWLFIKKYVDFVPVKLSMIFQHLKGSAAFFTAQIAGTLYGAIPVNLLGFFTSFTIVGYFANAGSVIGIASATITAIDFVLLPKMSATFSNKGKSHLVLNIQKTIHIQLFLLVGLFYCLLSIYADTIPWFFGKNFIFINHFMPILIPIVLIQPLGVAILNQYLIPLNYTKIYNFSIISGMFFSICANLILIPILGIWGAVIVWPLSEVIVTSIRVCYLLKTSSFKFNLKLIIKLLLIGAVAWLTVYLLTLNFAASFQTTCIQGFLFITIYFILTLIFKVNLIWNLLFKRA